MKLIGFFVEDEVAEKIKKIAKDNGMTVSSFLRFIVFQYLQEKEKGGE